MHTQAGVIDLVARKRQAMERERGPIRQELSAGPVRHRSPHHQFWLAIAHVSQIAAVSDRRSIDQFACPLMPRTTWHAFVRRRMKITPLKRGDGAVDGAFAPARDARQGIFGGATERGAIGGGERAGKMGNQKLRIYVVGEQHWTDLGLRTADMARIEDKPKFLLCLRLMPPAARLGAFLF